MKKIVTNFSLIASVFIALAGSATAQASDGIITINGSILDSTCQINGVASPTSADLTVTLPQISKSALNKVGMVAGQTPFTLTLTKCPNTGQTATAYFEYGPNVDSTTGNLKLTSASTAKNVQIQFTNDDSSPIKLGQPYLAQGVKGSMIDSLGNATLRYVAAYVAVTGPATAGTVNSSITYSIEYQ